MIFCVVFTLLIFIVASVSQRVDQHLRTCDTITGRCEVHSPRIYRRLGKGVADLEGNTIARVVPCSAACCKKECDADINCFSFSSRMDFCMLQDRCVQSTQTLIPSPYHTYFVENCTGKLTEDSDVEFIRDAGAKIRHNMRIPTVGGPATRSFKTTVNIERARKVLGLKPKGAFDKNTPKKLIVGNVWEQMGEGVRSLTEAMLLANATGRQFVLPYIANPSNITNTNSRKFDASVFKGNKVNPWGDNPDFSTIFEPNEFRKCFPKLTVHDSLANVTVGDDIIGIFFNYPNDRQHPFSKELKRTKEGVLDCSEYALQTYFHKYELDAFSHMPQMTKILCFDNDMRRRYTTRGLFEDLLGGYNTLYFINWRGIRIAAHRVRLPDTYDADPWGPLYKASNCVFDGRHVFSKDLNRIAAEFVDKKMPLQSFSTLGCNGIDGCEAPPDLLHLDDFTSDYMVIHLRLEKVYKAPGMNDGTLLPKFIKSMRNIQKYMSIEAGLPPGVFVPIYLATDSKKSRTFDTNRGLNKGQPFSDAVRAQLSTHTINCGAHGHWDNSVACAAIELLIMARSKHLVQVGASSFTKWGTEMMNVSSTTRMGNKGDQGVCIYHTKAKSTMKFGKIYSDLVHPITFCKVK